jgi:hypothetical protein
MAHAPIENSEPREQSWRVPGLRLQRMGSLDARWLEGPATLHSLKRAVGSDMRGLTRRNGQGTSARQAGPARVGFLHQENGTFVPTGSTTTTHGRGNSVRRSPAWNVAIARGVSPLKTAALNAVTLIVWVFVRSSWRAGARMNGAEVRDYKKYIDMKAGTPMKAVLVCG